MIEQKINKISKILEDHEKRIRELENIAKKNRFKPPADLNERIKKLFVDVGISEEQLRYVFDFEEDDLNLITSVEGKSEGEKQLSATLCILTGYEYCYGRDTIKSQILRDKLEKLGIRSLANLSTNLSKYPNYIISKGKRKSPNFMYKLTYPGKNEGLRIIKSLSKSLSGDS